MTLADIFPKDRLILIWHHTVEVLAMILAVAGIGWVLDCLVADKWALLIFHTIEYLWIGISLLYLLAFFTKEMHKTLFGDKNEQHAFNFA